MLSAGWGSQTHWGLGDPGGLITRRAVVQQGLQNSESPPPAIVLIKKNKKSTVER